MERMFTPLTHGQQGKKTIVSKWLFTFGHHHDLTNIIQLYVFILVAVVIYLEYG